jgi:hypothetical protein
MRVRRLAPSDLAFLESARRTVVVRAHIPATPMRVFDVIADQSTWPSWCFDLVDARWSSGSSSVDAVRIAKFRSLTFEERILAWDPGSRFAFSVDACTIKIARRAAEDWRLAADGDGTLLTWTLAVDVNPIASMFWPLGRIALRRIFRRTAQGLARYSPSPSPPTLPHVPSPAQPT